MTESHASCDAVSVSIGRQPVFDEKNRLWGYELFCVGKNPASDEDLAEATNAAISVESSAYVCLQQILKNEKKVIIDFSEKNILNGLPYTLPPVLTTVQVAEHVCLQQPVMEELNRLKEKGYQIAVRAFSGDSACDPLYRLADIISIQVGKKSSTELANDLLLTHDHKASLLAMQVHDRKLFDDCRDMGFSLFHGAFFKAPDKVTVRKLSSNEALRLKLLQLIESDDFEIAKIAETIQADVTISFRMLAYLNSAAFAFSQKIRSIQQAIALLGWANVKNWLRVVLLTDMSQSRYSQELVLLSAQRGMFLEHVGREHTFWGFDPDSLHLLGLFSLLDAMLAIPMTEVVTFLPIENKMKAALCCEPNNEYQPLLNLARCLEETRWEDAETLIQQLNLDKDKIMAAFRNSINWAAELDSLHSYKPAAE